MPDTDGTRRDGGDAATERVVAELRELKASLEERLERLALETQDTEARIEATSRALNALLGCDAAREPTPRRHAHRRRSGVSSNAQCLVAVRDGHRTAYASKTEACRALGISTSTLYLKTRDGAGSHKGTAWQVVPNEPEDGREILDARSGVSYATLADAAVGAGVTRAEIALDVTSEAPTRFEIVEASKEADWE